ncbi:hypothetical protein [Nonomuraea zeae]|uniref:Secreted protein n=1 Tax=Nonomuraea zeae TaxID=1642303 RepID=A0A5S4G9G0_9ACTN|nr:hypothetical protein [Nonomuraea zeae]TMR29647.1 hypothetical protein ETD85_31605 [Nonomuraea zeae]
MTISRSLAVLAIAATATLTITTAAAQAATPAADSAAGSAAKAWGPYYAPGHAARAAGTLTATGEDHADIPAASVLKVSGKVYDQTRKSATCGWAVFRITYRDAKNNLPFKHHSVRDCTYRTAKRFSFEHHDVYQVELKVCAGGKTAKPSLTCLYAGTWKTLYLSK